MPVAFLDLETEQFRVPETEQSRVMGPRSASLADGVYRVLATLVAGEKRYRVFAELLVDDGEAELRFYRFEVPTKDELFAERKIAVPVARSEV